MKLLIVNLFITRTANKHATKMNVPQKEWTNLEMPNKRTETVILTASVRNPNKNDIKTHPLYS